MSVIVVFLIYLALALNGQNRNRFSDVVWSGRVLLIIRQMSPITYPCNWILWSNDLSWRLTKIFLNTILSVNRPINNLEFCIYSYSRIKDHFRTASNWLLWQLFFGLIFFNIQQHLNNFRLSTTANLVSQIWSLFFELIIWLNNKYRSA